MKAIVGLLALALTGCADVGYTPQQTALWWQMMGNSVAPAPAPQRQLGGPLGIVQCRSVAFGNQVRTVCQ